MENEKVFEMSVGKVYPLLVAKAERKDRSKAEVGIEANRLQRSWPQWDIQTLLSRILFAISVISLVIGAAFHGYRMHPENVETYKIGVTMGIVMISIFVVSLVGGIVMSVLARKK